MSWGDHAYMRNALIILVAAFTIATPAYADDTPSGIIVRQAPPRSTFRSMAYARLGYGAAFADEPRVAPAFGFGFRGEIDKFALDVSLFNFLVRADPYVGSGSTFAGSALRLQVLRFVEPQASRSMYIGGGMSWGVADIDRRARTDSTISGWNGSGLQAEFTTGYAFRGETPLQAFVQADLGLPFFRAVGIERTLSSAYSPTGGERRYIPSVVVSFGLGWDARRRP